MCLACCSWFWQHLSVGTSGVHPSQHREQRRGLKSEILVFAHARRGREHNQLFHQERRTKMPCYSYSRLVSQHVLLTVCIVSPLTFRRIAPLLSAPHQVASTRLNEDSSRSHSVCMVSTALPSHLTTREWEPNPRRFACFLPPVRVSDISGNACRPLAVECRSVWCLCCGARRQTRPRRLRKASSVCTRNFPSHPPPPSNS